MSRRLVATALLLLAAACTSPTAPAPVTTAVATTNSPMNTTAPSDTVQRGGYVLPH